jgi:hypothetical protein
MTVRDNVLSPLSKAWQKIADLGFQRTHVAIRVRTWAGTRVGDDGGQTPRYTDAVAQITSTPTVSPMSPYAAQMAGIMTSAGDVKDRYYKIDDIMPQFIDRVTGLPLGFTPQQLDQLAAPGVRNVEAVFVLTGDDGVPRTATLVTVDFTDPFAYSLVVRLRDNDS